MCGIVGLISKTPVEIGVIQTMGKSLRHRGPDAEGNYVNETATVVLGHTRLSIIDLHESANQPLVSNNGRYVIVFNGEIYNFKTLRKELQEEHKCVFRTNSDTE